MAQPVIVFAGTAEFGQAGNKMFIGRKNIFFYVNVVLPGIGFPLLFGKDTVSGRSKFFQSFYERRIEIIAFFKLTKSRHSLMIESAV